MLTQSIAADPGKVELSAGLRERLAAFRAAYEQVKLPLGVLTIRWDQLQMAMAEASMAEATAVAAEVGRMLSAEGKVDVDVPDGD